MRDPGRRLIAPLLPLAVFAYLVRKFYPYTVDDAFITLRYVRNFLEGQGLVFNPGERIEGFSNLLWALMLAPLGRLGFDLVAAAKLLGVASAAGVLILVMEICVQDLELGYGIALAVTTWLASATGFVYYAASGLETVQYSLMIALFVLLLLRGRLWPAAVACGLLCLSRPEGVMFGLPFLLRALAERVRWWKACALLAIPAAFVLGMTLWRWSTYGALLPNTFQTKISMGEGPARFALTHLRGFLEYTLLDLQANGMIWLAAIPGFLLLLTRRRAVVPVAAALVGGFVWFSGGDWMSYSRFYVPAYPLMAVAAGYALWSAGRALRDSRLHRAAGALAMWLPAATAFLLTIQERHLLRDNHGPNPAMSSRPHIEIGRYLAGVGSPGDAVAVNEVGAIGYYSRLRMIDMLGLTDRKIPAMFRQKDLSVYGEYVVGQKPRYVLINDRQLPWETKMHPFHQAILDAMTRSGEYRYERSFTLNHFKHLLLYVRK